MKNTGVVVYSNPSKEKSDAVCKMLKKHFSMPLYFETHMINNQYSVLFDPWDGYMLSGTDGYVDEIKRYLTRIDCK